jgi:predicted nucleic acid-binding protein
VAAAEDTYVDPNALARLYLHQAGSRELSEWRRRHRGALAVTHHGRTEIVNAIGLAAFRRSISLEKAEAAQVLFEADFAAGHLEQVDLLWRGALNRAAELSRIHTPKLGTRSLDVLHVACALELKLRHFVTFDNRQRQLARATGLRIVAL